MPLPTKKRKRKLSKDKDIEALLVLKDNWNFQASNFINELIALKRGVNGRGDPQYMLPPTRVTNTVDPKISSFLNQLAQKYRTLSSNALEIVQKQNELSKMKAEQKSEHKSKNHDGDSSDNPFSALTGKASSYEALLISEATNPLTRNLWRFKSLFKGDPNRRAKWDILSLSVEAKQAAKDLQNASVSRGDDVASKLETHFNTLRDKFKDIGKFLRTTINQNDAEFGTLVIDDPLLSELKNFQREFNSAYNLGETNLRSRFIHFDKQFRNASDEVEKKLIISQISEYYEKVKDLFKKKYPNEWKGSIYQLEKTLPLNMKKDKYLDRLNDLQEDNEQEVNHIVTPNTNVKPNDGENTVDEHPFEIDDSVGIGDQFRTKKSSQLSIVAHSFISRHLKKKVFELPFSGRSSLFRINLYNKTDEMIKKLNAFMDYIQKDSSDKELYEIFNSMKKLLEDIRIEKDNVVSFVSKNEEKPVKSK